MAPNKSSRFPKKLKSQKSVMDMAQKLQILNLLKNEENNIYCI